MRIIVEKRRNNIGYFVFSHLFWFNISINRPITLKKHNNVQRGSVEDIRQKFNLNVESINSYIITFTQETYLLTLSNL